MIHVLQSFYREWKTWWQDTALFTKGLVAILLILVPLLHHYLGGFEYEHLLVSILIGILYYSGPKGQHLLKFILPLLLVGVIYDAQKYFATAIRGAVRIQEPYELELMLFGINGSTLARWWQSHTHPLLDAITGFAYITFIPAYVLMAAWFCFYLPNRNKDKKVAHELRRTGYTMMLALLGLNCFSYLTYLIYPAAPPWYVDHYGFEFIPNAPPEAAGTERFDTLLGKPIFENYYAKNTNVFGAIPSVHCGQTFLALYFALWSRRLRIACLLFFAAVFFGSVYLNHHYIIDGLIGIAYATVIGFICIRIMKLKRNII